MHDATPLFFCAHSEQPSRRPKVKASALREMVAYVFRWVARSVGDPTQFEYTPNGMVSHITMPTGSVATLAPVQTHGLDGASQGGGNFLAPATLAGTAANVTDPGGHVTSAYTDGRGLGQVQQMPPGGSTSLTDRDANGLPWLTATPMGDPMRSFFDGQGNECCVVCASMYGDDG